MKTLFLVIGKTIDKHLVALIDDYAARVKHYQPFDIEVIPELKQTKALTESQQKELEASMILGRIQPGDRVVLLDEHGVERRSIEFAQWMQKKMVAGIKRLLCIVGGPYGFAPNVYERADEKISLSQMTLSHQMIRLLFVEQVYRAMTILNGEPYHHE